MSRHVTLGVTAGGGKQGWMISTDHHTEAFSVRGDDKTTSTIIPAAPV
jgi:hypothetical protein